MKSTAERSSTTRRSAASCLSTTSPIRGAVAVSTSPCTRTTTTRPWSSSETLKGCGVAADTPEAASTVHRPPRHGKSAVALPDQLEPLEREPVVHLVHLLAERHDRSGEAARGDRGGLLAELLAHPPYDRVDLAGE